MSQLTVVVADSSRARLFAMGMPRLPLVEIEGMLNPDGRLADHELRDDAPGSDAEARGPQHAGEHASMKQNHIAQFAHEVAAKLAHRRSVGKMEKLAVVAPPRFLGLLRDEFDGPLKQCVVAEVDKNLVRESSDKIRQHLPDHF